MTTIGPKDATFDVPDPTDWKGTALHGLAAVESPMRCQICKEFMTTPMMTSCGHTFCSLCIRRCLANDGLCPACRTRDQEFKLRANKSMGEVIESFQQIRASALEIARTPSLSDSRAQKRKRDASISNGQDLEKRRTRSSARIASQEPLESPTDATYIEQSDGANGPGGHSSSESNNISGPSVTTNLRLQRPSFDPTPLPTLNYSLLNDTNLRKKLKDLGISNTGNRPALERRHREWLTLWNANCDAAKPRSKAELLRELDTWERIQAGPGTSRNYTLGSGGLPIGSQDFDTAAWSSKYGSAYHSLIEEAARNRRQKSSGVATSTSAPIDVTNDVSGDGLNDGTKDSAD
ncbi:E3 ubiquitin-protein ligase rad18 [Pseudogymnoascus australis]